ncbi:hypothetical protein BFL38_04145 [Brachyspira hampsonii]|uniref:Lipocalin-like domain-containing protein n=1 Tax=Brachyspira hampsonii TaxID=1287055 RepID=A0A1E5NCP4_9SPIR|nr:hypothetical protein [Brachyspira hampsonii]OEJ13936.1 hypothetical protein BFL38_04145 [Brachyspira hampsonii]
MNKKLFSILFTLFLAGILSVNCSNKDKTGSGGNAKIDSKYAGTWVYTDSDSSTAFIVNSDGSLVFGQDATTQVEGSGDTYIVTIIIEGTTYKIQIKFTSETAAEISNVLYPEDPKQYVTKQQQ